nr:Transcriptional regulator, MarR family [Kibdelosporangium sp. MJ126-NF4]
MVEPDAVDEITLQWARERPGMPLDSIGIVGRVLRIAKLLTDERRRTLATLDVDNAVFDLLATLRRAGSPYRLSPTELADGCLVSGGAITQRVTRAEDAGLVRTSRTDSGKRTLTVELTPLGHQVIEHGVETLIGHEHDLVGHLTPAEREQLANLLRRMLGGLT